jgi:hypothetical protein
MVVPSVSQQLNGADSCVRTVQGISHIEPRSVNCRPMARWSWSRAR